MDTVSNVTDLKNKFERVMDQGRLTLGPATSFVDSLASFLNSLPSRQVALSGVTLAIDNAATKLTLSGNTQENWPVRGITVPLQLTRLTFTFAVQSAAIKTQMSAEAEILAGTTPVPLSGSLQPNNVLSFTWPGSTPASISLPLIANLISNNALAPHLPALSIFNAEVPFTGLSFSFGFARLTPAQFTFTSNMNAEWTVIEGAVVVRQVGITLGASFAFQAKDARITETLGGYVSGKLTLGKASDFDVRIGVQGQDQWEVAVLPANGNVLPGLDDLAGLAGGDALRQTIQQGLNNLGLNSLSIDGVRIGFDLARKALRTIAINAHITVEGVTFRIQASLPNFAFWGSLSPGTPLHLGTWLGQHFGSPDSFPDVAIDSLGISAQPSSGTYNFYASIAGNWALNLGSIPVAFQQFDCNVSYGKNRSGLTGVIHGRFSLANVEFNCTAQHSGDAGWDFLGASAPGQMLPVGTFLQELAHVFGISDKLPSPIANFTISDLQTSFNTQVHSFTFDCAGHSTISGQEVSVNIDLALNRPASGPGLIFTGSVKTSVLPVEQFVRDCGQQIGVTVPDALVKAVQGLQVESLEVKFDTQQKLYAFAANLSVTGHIPFGTKSYDLQTRASFSSTTDAGAGQRTLTGHMEADLQIGKASFVIAYDFGPAAKVITGSWRSDGTTTLGFGDIADALGIAHNLTLPEGLDLGLKSASFDLRVSQDLFSLSAESTKFGDAFFTAGKGQDGQWGFIFGVDFPGMKKLSSLPAIGNDLKAADFLTFKQLGVILASTTFKNYTVPALPQLPGATGVTAAPAAKGRSIQPVAASASLQISPGLSLVADIDFSSSTDARTKNLHSIVAKDELVLQATLGTTGLTLFIELGGKVDIPGAGKSKLALANPALKITLTTEIVFQLSGELDMTINGAQIAAIARLIIDESEAQVAIDITSQHGTLPPPPGVKGLHFEDFGMQMGVFFEPPGIDLGLQGKFRIGEVQAAQADQFAIVLELVEELPDILYLAFYVDKLDLGQVVTLFTDQTDPSMIKSLEVVKGSDLGFHWSENVVVLPDGTIAQPGFGFSGTIQILSFGAHADLEVSATQGIRGRAEMSPIDLRGVLKVAGGGKGITRTYQQLNGQWQEAANNAIVRQVPPLPTRQEVMIPPGGPVIEFNTRSPFLNVNLMVSLFDVVRESTQVTITDKGFSFHLTYNVAGIERFDLQCALNGPKNFNASAVLHIGLDARIGPIHVAGVDCGRVHLVTKVDANMSVVLDATHFSMEIAGNFDFENVRLSLPNLTITVAFSSLKELPGKVLKQIQDHADQIFASLFSDAQKWANMIGRGVVTGVTDMAQTLKHAYNVSAQQAAQLMKTARQTGQAVASGLKTAYSVSANEAATLMKGAGYAASDVAQGLKQGYALTGQAAATALRGAGYTANEVGNALKSAFSSTAQQAAQLLKGAGYAANDVGNALHSAFGSTPQDVAKALKGAGYAANEVSSALQRVFGSSAQQIAQLLRGAGFDATTVGNALHSAFGITEQAAAQALRAAGYPVNDVGNALKSAYGASASAISSALKGAGYAVNEVGGFVKDAFHLNPDQLNSVLRGAGFAADQVKGFFNNLGGDFKNLFGSAGDEFKKIFHL